MPGLAGGSRLVEVDVKEAGTEGGEGKAGGGGERAGGEDGQAHVGEGEQGFRQGTEIPGTAGEAHNFVDGGAGFAELRQQPLEPQGSQFPFEGVGGKNQIPPGTTDGTENAAEPGQVGELEIDDIGKREKGEEEENPLAGAPIKRAAFFAGAEGEEHGEFLFGQGGEDCFGLHSLGEKKIEADFREIDIGRRGGEVGEALLSGDGADG